MQSASADGIRMPTRDFPIVFLREDEGHLCYAHPVGIGARDLPLVAAPDGDRTTCAGDPFLFRGVYAEHTERGITGALIEEVRRRRREMGKQDPFHPESLEGWVQITRWHYRNLDLVNATLQRILDAFLLPTSIVGDPGMTPNYRRWRKLFRYIYVEGLQRPDGSRVPWTQGVVMPSAAGADLRSIVVPRALALNLDHFRDLETETLKIPDTVISYVLGDVQLPDGWTAV